MFSNKCWLFLGVFFLGSARLTFGEKKSFRLPYTLTHSEFRMRCKFIFQRMRDNTSWHLGHFPATNIKTILSKVEIPQDPKQLDAAFNLMKESMLDQLPPEKAQEINNDLNIEGGILVHEPLISGYTNGKAYTPFYRHQIDGSLKQEGKYSIAATLPKELIGTPVELLIKVHELQHLIHFSREFGPEQPIRQHEAAEAKPVTSLYSAERDSIGMEWEILQLIPDEISQKTLTLIEKTSIDRPETLAAPFRYRHLPKNKFITQVGAVRHGNRFKIWLKNFFRNKN